MQYFPTVRYLDEAGLRYCRRRGLPVPHVDYHRVVVDPVRGLRIAAAYLEAPWYDEAALGAYRAFREETLRQFDFLTSSPLLGGLAVAVEPVPLDPYPDAAAMARDLRDNRRLRVYESAASDNPHPVLDHDENTMFRAVHDAFAHASIGRGFDHHGEEAAWLKHSFMYSATARRALTTETRGQNSAMVFGYTGRRFAEQKAVLLPEPFSDPAGVTLTA
ncbi:hypothetical protein [Actinosynnema sp. NPDC020468]|uniref:hypothetical protein n=1 Tax=Actinosynnema sp. NPDC020468 TaxID=3154488 RepID=UPI0033F89120